MCKGRSLIVYKKTVRINPDDIRKMEEFWWKKQIRHATNLRTLDRCLHPVDFVKGKLLRLYGFLSFKLLIFVNYLRRRYLS